MTDHERQRNGLLRGIRDEMVSLNRKIGAISESFKIMNNNHAEFGQGFKTWLDTSVPEVELCEQELPDRAMFQVGMSVKIIDRESHWYRYIGVINEITSAGLLLTIEGYNNLRPFKAPQVEIAPSIHVGASVKIVDENSIAFGEVGKVVKIELDGDYEVKFSSGSGGAFSRSALELCLIIHRYEVDDIVKVTELQSAFHDKEGTVVGCFPDHVRVMFPGIEGYSTFTPNEVEKIGEQPYKAEVLASIGSIENHEGTFKKFITDEIGRLTPPEWRHNLGWVRMPPGVGEEEDALMTEEAFRIYNAGLTGGNS